MVNNSHNHDLTHNHDLRRRVDALVKRWLNQRQTLIVLMFALHERNSAIDSHPYARPSVRIQAFCQMLMDYVSAGHFEIYDQLLAEAEHGGLHEAIRRAQQLYPRLQRSTDAAVRFNDIYDTPEHTAALLENLPLELNELGLLLESRFELEDRLIGILHRADAPYAAPPATHAGEVAGWQA